MLGSRSKNQKLPEDAFDSLSPVYSILKILSLVSIRRENKHLVISYSAAKRIFVIVILVGIIVTVATFKIIYFHRSEITVKCIKFTDSIQVTYLLEFALYIIHVFFVYKYGSYMTLKYFNLYEQIDKILGMAYYSDIKSDVAKTTLLICVFTLITSVLDFIALYVNYGWIMQTLYSIEYLFFIINALIVIEMISSVILLKYRLRTMGDILHDFYSSASNTSAVIDVVTDKNWLYNTEEKKIRKLKSTKVIAYSCDYDVIWLNKCYLLLLEQNSFINKYFGFRVLLNNAYLLLCMVNTINMAIRITIGAIVMPNNWYFPAITSILRTLNCVLIISTLVRHCEMSYSQAARILSIIDHILVDKKINATMTSALTETRSLILSRPIDFHAMQFYRLDYRFMASANSVVVTLTIILLQNVQ